MAPFNHDPAEVDRIADLCAALAGPNEDTIPGNVRRNSRSYPLWYFPHAIRQALGTATDGKLWSYAFGVIKNLWLRGVVHESELIPAERMPASPPAPSVDRPPHVRPTPAGERRRVQSDSLLNPKPSTPKDHP